MKKRLLFIINPISGKGDKQQLIARIKAAFKNEVCKVETTQRPGHATRLAENAVRLGYDAVIACGGDGTVNEIGRVLINTRTALGIIPVGSGNGLARHLHIPLNSTDALDVIGAGNTINIDTGTVNKRPFIGMAGLGFDAYIGRKFLTLERRGFLSYVWLISRKIFKYREKRVVLRIKGKEIRLKPLLVSIANADQFGNNAVIAPGARINDGFLRICVLNRFPLWKLPIMAWKLMTGRIDRSGYLDIHVVTKATILHKRKYIHMDGEPVKVGKLLKVKVLPGSLKVIVP